MGAAVLAVVIDCVRSSVVCVNGDLLQALVIVSVLVTGLLDGSSPC